LVSRVVPDAELLDEVLATAATAADHSVVMVSDIALRWSGLSRVSSTTPSEGRSNRRCVMDAGY
jgi:hypothetical protein